MTSVKVANVSDIPIGQMRAFTVEGNEYLVANVDGNFYCIDNLCSHLRAPLSEGKLDGSTVICPKHHSSFDVMTGKALTLRGHDLNSYRVEIKATDILIHL